MTEHEQLETFTPLVVGLPTVLRDALPVAGSLPINWFPKGQSCQADKVGLLARVQSASD